MWSAAARSRSARRLLTPLLRSAAPRFASAVPDQARVVVVGGGIIGSSVAYHLAHLGWKDVVLLERDKLTSGTTWHAAGLMVTFGSTSRTSTDMRKYSRDLYSSLEEETGQTTGFDPIGFIELATSTDRLEEYRRIADVNRFFGVDVHEIGPKEVERLFPLCKVDDVLAGFYVEGDGRVNPVDATMALSKGARQQGARIIEECAAIGVTQENGRVTGVVTNRGTIKAEYVVNCAGMWARQFGELAGVNIPLQAAEHYYLITGPMPQVDPKWPVVEDPSSYTYIRPEGAGMMVGLFEAEAAAWSVEGIPESFSFGELPPDWDRMTPYLEKALSRVPATLDAGVNKFFCGPESFTPDLAPIVGPAPELDNYWVAAGMNSIGILTGAGMGRLVAHWMVHGQSDVDVTGIHIDRLQRYQATTKYRAARVVESLGMVYKCHYPNYLMQTARGAKQSPLHARLVAQGASFRDVSGWESADWFAGPGQTPDPGPLTFGRPAWFDRWAEEHKACRESVILMDMSFMSKFQVTGPDAGDALNFLCTSDVQSETGKITYTQWLNAEGRLEGDVTVSKLGDERFMVVVTDTQHRHAEAWLRRNLRAFPRACATDVTGAWAQINLQGPNSRALLQELTSADLSNEAFPFRTAREIDIGFARVICNRITYLGELGYELLVPTEQAVHVYDLLVEAGPAHGLRHAGLKALASLRLEKGYRDYGHDMDNTDTPLECGLGFTCNFDKPKPFLGQDAVLRQKAEKGLKRRLAQVLVTDPEPVMYHSEVLHRDGKPIADVLSASYGHTLGGAVGLAMLEAEEPIGKKWLDGGKWEVQIAGKMYPAKVSLRPMYDPKSDRIKM